MATLEESSCSDGRADLVWATLLEDWTPDFSDDALELLSQPTCSRSLALLKPHAPRRDSYLLERAGVSPRRFKYWLRCLYSEGLIEESDEGRWVLGPEFGFPQLDICAFEFKLENWKRALYQAQRYRTFSHRVFVVMPPESGARAFSARETFERFNIGLMTHDVHGETEVLVPSRKRQPTAQFRFIMAMGMLFGAAIAAAPSLPA